MAPVRVSAVIAIGSLREVGVSWPIPSERAQRGSGRTPLMQLEGPVEVALGSGCCLCGRPGLTGDTAAGSGVWRKGAGARWHFLPGNSPGALNNGCSRCGS
jgi:hypothetical protein